MSYFENHDLTKIDEKYGIFGETEYFAVWLLIPAVSM